jgi:hypothetical protein
MRFADQVKPRDQLSGNPAAAPHDTRHFGSRFLGLISGSQVRALVRRRFDARPRRHAHLAPSADALHLLVEHDRIARLVLFVRHVAGLVRTSLARG